MGKCEFSNSINFKLYVTEHCRELFCILHGKMLKKIFTSGAKWLLCSAIILVFFFQITIIFIPYQRVCCRSSSGIVTSNPFLIQNQFTVFLQSMIPSLKMPTKNHSSNSASGTVCPFLNCFHEATWCRWFLKWNILSNLHILPLTSFMIKWKLLTGFFFLSSFSAPPPF